MGLESATFIHQLDPANPIGASDPKSQGDDHIRLLKTTLQNTFPDIDGVMTASHTELSKLDGVTATTAEINKLAGLTATTAELNKLAGTAAGLTAAELSLLDGVTATTAEINKLAGLTATTAELNKLAGTAAGLTAAELSILDGVTATATEINKLAGLTATTVELNKLAGVAAGLTAAELSFVDGVTSAIQTQINTINTNKLSGTYTPTISNPTNLDSTTPQVCQWMRVDNTVTVSGEVVVDPTAASLATFGLSLPIASNFANARQLAGGGWVNQGPPFAFVAIRGNSTNDVADVLFVSLGTASTNLYFHFTYQIV
jgi:hypothetical protein